jgi:hypothetical protein
LSKTFQEEALFELKFWMRILGDHSRFILESLAPTETEKINNTQYFIQLFDHLLQKIGKPLEMNDFMEILKQGRIAGEWLRVYKLSLIREQLIGKVGLSLTPTFLNHMVNELDEWLRVSSFLVHGQRVPAAHPLHHDFIWLLDAAGHAGAIHDQLDAVEKDLKEKSSRFITQFEQFYLKAVEMAGFLRANIEDFPALKRFHEHIELELTIFQSFLREIENLEVSKEILSSLSPLIADHMFREECYYLIKLSETTNKVKKPKCDPIITKLNRK